MNDSRAYSYTILRYVHDVVTGEFINVGVVLYFPSTGSILARTRKTIARIKDTFPDLNRMAFTESMRAIDRSVRLLSKESANSPLLSKTRDAASIARRIVPFDDSSLQWSPVGTGVSEDPQRTLDRLYKRLVVQYDEESGRRRSDEEIWRPVRQKLEERDLASRLQEKTIAGAVDQIAFKHAFKNSQWHTYEPISLDLADAEGIKEKARRWRGHLSSVSDGLTESFKPHFLLGAPSNPSLKSAYQTAITILRKAPFEPEIVEEHQIDDLVGKIEDVVLARDRTATHRTKES